MSKKYLLLVPMMVIATQAWATGKNINCKVPDSEKQPIEALQKKLEAKGWKVNKIKVDNGCYETYAIDEKGKKVEVYFDPKTLEEAK